jgi:hypothetical protein
LFELNKQLRSSRNEFRRTGGPPPPPHALRIVLPQPDGSTAFPASDTHRHSWPHRSHFSAASNPGRNRGGVVSRCAHWAGGWHEAPVVQMVPARSHHRRTWRQALLRAYGAAGNRNAPRSRVAAQPRGAEAAAAGTAWVACGGPGVGRRPPRRSQICC